MPIQYTNEMRQFILDNYKGLTSMELAERFNNRFKVKVTSKQMLAFRKRYRLCSGVDTRFKPGGTPANKGKKISPEAYAKCERTMFKKGHVPTGHRPVGSERINIDGYIEVKVAEPRKWRFKHVVVWESVHGPVPKGMAIIFLDGNKLNTDINNLRMVSRTELLILNRNKLMTDYPEVNDTAITLAKVIDATNKAKRERLQG